MFCFQVRQSPRQHASTRALYSCGPKLVSKIVQNRVEKRQTADFDCTTMAESSDPESIEHISPSSPAFIRFSRKSNVTPAAKSMVDDIRFIIFKKFFRI